MNKTAQPILERLRAAFPQIVFEENGDEPKEIHISARLQEPAIWENLNVLIEAVRGYFKESGYVSEYGPATGCQITMLARKDSDVVTYQTIMKNDDPVVTIKVLYWSNLI